MDDQKKARKRRGRGEGAIFQRGDGLWVTSLSLGYDENGKRKRKTIYGHSKKEVQDELRKLQNSAATGQIAEAGSLTVAQYLKRWLEDTAKAQVAPKTHLRYEQLVRLRVNPHVGGVRLAKLAPLHVQQLFAALEKEGVTARGRQMAGTMLHTALRDAVRLRLIPFNPASEVAKPRPRKQEMRVYDQDQVARFLTAAKDGRLYALYVAALDTGMRQGELFALQWPDLDFAAGAVLVQRSLEEINGKLRLKETKSAKGRRRIDLSRFAVDALHEHRKAMLAEGQDVKAGPVFCAPEGNWLRKGNFLRRSFWPLIERANREAREAAERAGAQPPDDLPVIRFHDLRHTSATLLLSQGVHPKVVQERLGHASIQLTLDTYSHVLPTMQQAAAAKMDGIFGKKAANG